MTAAQFEYHDLVLVPLTPIHVGGGDEAYLGPEDYRLKGQHLERVNLRDYLLSSPNCDSLLRDLDRDMSRTLSRIRDRIPDAEVSERIVVSEKACDELTQVFQPMAGRGGAQRQGTVHAFLRSGGYPTLPGSSLKGCLRTAWLARCVQDQGLSQCDAGGRNSLEKNGWLVKSAFKVSDNETAKDPFRDVVVADTRIPGSATRVDLVSSWKFDRKEKTYAADPSGKIQLMRERLRSVTDGGEPPLIPVRIGLRSNCVRTRRSEAGRADVYPRQSPGSIFELLSALEEHHLPLWKREMEKFFSGTEQRLGWALGLFSGVSRDGDRPEAALLRIGWASHAEAKSIAGFREIQGPQFRGTVKEGSARHVVDLPNGPSPFGWALLVMDGVWQKKRHSVAWLPLAEGTERRSGGRLKIDPRLGKGPDLQYRKGDQVLLHDGADGMLLEDVKHGQKEVMVEIDGSPDRVKVSEIERLA